MKTRPRPALTPADLQAAQNLGSTRPSASPAPSSPPLGPRPSRPPGPSPARAKALAELSAVLARHGEAHPIDVEAAARKLSHDAAQSLRTLFDEVQRLKAAGRLEDVGAAEQLTTPLLRRLDDPKLPKPLARHVRKLACREVFALFAGPRDDELRAALGPALGKRYGFAKGELAAIPPELDLPLVERDERRTRALLALASDPGLPAPLRTRLTETLARTAAEGDLEALAALGAKAPELTSAVKATTDAVMAGARRTLVFVSMEARPYAGTGGLGNVMKELPRALARLGHRVLVVMPRHATIDRGGLEDTGLTGQIVGKTYGAEPFQILRDVAEGVETYFVENDKFFSAGRSGIYGDVHGGYGDNELRYDFLGAAVPQALKKILGDTKPDVVQWNDAHTATGPIYLRDDPWFAETLSVMAVHNLGAAYQGRTSAEKLGELMFDASARFYPGGPAEFFGGVNLLKLGMLEADGVITVSRRYKDEILTEAQGEGLHGVLRKLDGAGRMFGNMNGIDTTVWDPATDPLLPAHFSFADPSGKVACKAALLAQFGLGGAPGPLFGVVARLADQKGWDAVIAAIHHARSQGSDARFVMCGEGDAKLAAELSALAQTHPAHVAFDGAFTAGKEHLIYAGSDLFLMPSKFEPCGLPQMYAMRYLTAPIVRAVGGLDESVVPFDPKTGRGNGFKFAGAIEGAIDRALAWYASPPEARQTLIRNLAIEDFSWDGRSAREQLAIFRELAAGRAGG